MSDFADFGSDLAPRFTSLDNLMQRGSMLMVAAGLVTMAAVFHPRLDKAAHWRLSVCGIALIGVGALGIAFLVGRAVAGTEMREAWLAAHSRAAEKEASTRADIEQLTANVVVDPGSMMTVEATVRLRAPVPPAGDEGDGPRELDALVFSLNPGMRVTALGLDGTETEFTHRDGLLTVPLATPMAAGSPGVLSLQATGVPDWRFAHLDGVVDPMRLAASNRLGALGRQASIFEDAYVGLMPAVHWLPAGDQPIEFDGSAAAEGWNKLGVFDLAGGLVGVVVSNRTSGDIVIADAVRWLTVSEADNP